MTSPPINTLRSRSPKAQSLVEFALALPVFLLLVVGVLEFGRLLFTYSMVYTASREGARYGAAVGRLDDDSDLYFMDCEGIRNAARRLAVLASSSLADEDIVITYDNPDGTGFPSCEAITLVNQTLVEAGWRINVTVTIDDYEMLIPFVDLDSLDISSTSRRTIVRRVKFAK